MSTCDIEIAIGHVQAARGSKCPSSHVPNAKMFSSPTNLFLRVGFAFPKGHKERFSTRKRVGPKGHFPIHPGFFCPIPIQRQFHVSHYIISRWLKHSRLYNIKHRFCLVTTSLSGVMNPFEFLAMYELELRDKIGVPSLVQDIEYARKEIVLQRLCCCRRPWPIVD